MLLHKKMRDFVIFLTPHVMWTARFLARLQNIVVRMQQSTHSCPMRARVPPFALEFPEPPEFPKLPEFPEFPECLFFSGCLGLVCASVHLDTSSNTLSTKQIFKLSLFQTPR